MNEIDLFTRLTAALTKSGISKLEWAKRASSERQIEDVAGILKIQSEDLNYSYVEKRVQEIDLQEQWDQARFD